MLNMDDADSYYAIGVGSSVLYNARKTPHVIAMGYHSQYENAHSEDNISIGEQSMKEAGYAIEFDATSSSVVDISDNSFTISSTDFGYLNHRASGYHNNTQIRYYANGGTPIGGLSEDTAYYVTNDSTASALYLATATNKTSSNAVNLTSLGVGSGHYFVVEAYHNVFIGNDAGRYGRQIMQSVAIGSRAARGTQNDCTQEGNVNIGYAAGYYSQKSRYATQIGYLAGYSAEDSYMRTMIGARAGVYDKSLYSTGLGAYTLSASSGAMGTGDHNTAAGYSALNKNTTGTYNVAVGNYAMLDNTTGQRNTAMGYNALANSVSSERNVAIGFYAGLDITTGGYNTIVGGYAGDVITTGSHNTVIGYNAYQKRFGKANIAIGFNCMNGSQTGSGNSPEYNIGIGSEALQNITDGAKHNFGAGSAALEEVTTGDYNIAIGQDSGDTITTGSHNIALGYRSDVSSSGAAGQYAIGRQTVTDQNYQVAIGYSSTGNIRVEYDTDATWTQSSDIRKKKKIY